MGERRSLPRQLPDGRRHDIARRVEVPRAPYAQPYPLKFPSRIAVPMREEAVWRSRVGAPENNPLTAAAVVRMCRVYTTILPRAQEGVDAKL